MPPLCAQPGAMSAGGSGAVPPAAITPVATLEIVVANVLDEILASKRAEVEHARRVRPLEALQAEPAYIVPTRNFYGAVTAPRRGGPNLIAEVKRASPSAGVLCAAYDPVALATAYEAAGAAALSVLTDEPFFGGRLEHIGQIKAAVGLPVLRKDFLIDPYQVHESRAAGADAVLVIAEALADAGVAELVHLARSLGLWVLLEVHTEARLRSVLETLGGSGGPGVLLGINNRNLGAQTVDLSTTERLAPYVPRGIPIVAESGIRTRRDVERMHAAGACAVLVGEALLRSGDVGRMVQRLSGHS